MKTISTLNQFNMEKTVRMAQDYTLTTGVECLVIPIAQNTLFFDGESRQQRKEESADDEKQIIPKTLTSRFCPSSNWMLRWASPIVINGQIVAILSAGQGAVNDFPEDLLNASYHTSANHSSDQVSCVQETRIRSPLINERRLQSLKSILDMIARSCSDQQLPEAEFLDICNTFRKNYDFDISATKSIPWQKLLNAIFRKNRTETERIYFDLLEAIRNNRDLRGTRIALSQLIISLYHYALEKDDLLFLKECCLNALNELERINSLSELSMWSGKSLYRVIKACTLSVRSADSDFLTKAIQYIEQHYQKKITLQEIAALTHFSTSYFCKLFKSEAGITFSKFLINLRVEKSKQYLKNREYSLAQISTMVGFEEQSYFTRVFRVTTGISPGKYRSRIVA